MADAQRFDIPDSWGLRYLLSDFARYITGHVLVVDGGATLVGPERDAGGAGG